MVNVWIHALWKIHAETMHFVVFQSIVRFVCAQTDTEVNQHKDVHDPNVQLTVNVKLINDVKPAHV